ncbi:MAG: 30S ribosomal protein S6 [Ghiorsea sp.]|nr:30S ribosomal protein S6 [Ghiorsea sp.]
MYYETVFIVNPDVSQENTEVLTNELVEKIEKAGSRIVKREYWGVRSLAYSIQKRNRGHYALLVTDGAADIAKLIDESLRLDERILRFLTTSITELSDEPSPLLRRRPTATTTEEPKADADAKEADSKEKAKSDEPKAEEVKAESKVEETAEKADAEPKAEEKAAKEESGETTA